MYEAFGYLHARLIQAGESGQQLICRCRPVRSERGQGTVEYVALVLLVALVMFAVVAAMKTYKFGEGQELGDLIIKKIKEAVSKVRY